MSLALVLVVVGVPAGLAGAGLMSDWLGECVDSVSGYGDSGGDSGFDGGHDGGHHGGYDGGYDGGHHGDSGGSGE